MNLCPECLGRGFIYSPGGYAPKLRCPTCGEAPPPPTSDPAERQAMDAVAEMAPTDRAKLADAIRAALPKDPTR